MSKIDFETTSRLFVIPQYADNKEVLLAVDRRTKALARAKFGLYTEFDWECNTIATVTLSTLIRVLYLNIVGSGSDVLGIIEEDDEHNPYIDFLGLIRIQPSLRRNVKAEKEGSINCKFLPGPRSAEIVGDDSARGAEKMERVNVDTYYLTKNEKLDAAWDKFDTLVRRELSDNYMITLKYHFSAIAFAECFLESLYRELTMRLTMSGEMSTSTIVNEYFEISAIALQNPDNSVGVKFTMTPGKYSKLNIKSDATTEADED